MAGRADIEAGKAHVSVYMKDTDLKKGVSAVEPMMKRVRIAVMNVANQLDKVADRAKAVGASVMKAGAGITAVGAAMLAPFAGALKHFMDVGGALQDMANRTGLSTTALQEFKHAASQTGGSLEEVVGASKNLTKMIGEAKQGASGAHLEFSRLGLSVAQLSQMKPEDQFAAIADKISQIRDPAIKAATAAKLLGTVNLLPMVDQLGQLRQEARDLGLVSSEEAVANARKLGDLYAKTWSVIQATVFEVGAAVAPMLFPVLESATKIAATIARWVRENGSLIKTVALVGVGFVAVGSAVTAIGAAIFGIGAVLAGVSSIVAALVPVFAALTSPIALIAVGIGAAVFAWARFTESGRQSVAFFGQLLGKLWQTIQETVGGIGNALRAGDIALAGQIAAKGMQLAFMQAVDAIVSLIGGRIGGAIGQIATKSIQGDFAGAWEVAVNGMAVLWDSFTAGIIGAFADAANSVVNLWQKVVTQISDQILSLSTNEGIVGDAFATILGVDLREEQQRRDRLNAGLGLGPENVLQDAQRIAAGDIGGQADAARSVLDGLKTDANERLVDSMNRLDESLGSGGGTSEEVQRLTDELKSLRERADQQAKAAGGGIGGKISEFGGAGFAQQLQRGFTTFSGFALAAGGSGGGNAQQKQLQELQKANKLAAERVERDKAMLAANEAIKKNLEKVLQMA